MKGIYAITPDDIEENELIEKSLELIEAKINFLQIRRKADTLDQIYSVASKIVKFTKNHSCKLIINDHIEICLLYTSPSPRDKRQSRMPSSA